MSLKKPPYLAAGRGRGGTVQLVLRIPDPGLQAAEQDRPPAVGAGLGALRAGPAAARAGLQGQAHILNEKNRT